MVLERKETIYLEHLLSKIGMASKSIPMIFVLQLIPDSLFSRVGPGLAKHKDTFGEHVSRFGPKYGPQNNMSINPFTMLNLMLVFFLEKGNQTEMYFAHCATIL